MTPAFLETQKERLLSLQERLFARLNEINKDVCDETCGGCGLHIGDRGYSATETEFSLTLLSMEKDASAEIADALHRIRKGTYGICELTGDEIPIERLEVRPYARYTVKAQEMVERTPALARRRVTELFETATVGEDEDE